MMTNRELSINDTKMIKGLSVLAMICLHLFSRSYDGLFSPIIFIGDIPLSFYVSQISDFCIFGFAFCSGYAHMSKISNDGYYKNRLKSLLTLLCNYWMILIVFVIIAIIMGTCTDIPESALSFIKNFFLIEITYNGAWWYLFAFAVIVLMSPVILKLINKSPIILTGIICIILYSLGYYLRFNNGDINYVYIKAGQVCFVMAQYAIGALCFKEKWISKLYSVYIKVNKAIRIVGSIIIVAAMIYTHTKVLPSNYIAPITGFIIITLFTFWKKPMGIKKIFLFIGDHSTNIWLTHMFFFVVPFDDLVFIAKYPILIFLFMLCITIPLSIVLKLVLKPINKLISRI